MLYESAAFEQSSFRRIPVKHFSGQSTFLHSAEVRVKFLHLACAVEHVCPTIVVEEEGGIVEVRYAVGESPAFTRIFCSVNISLPGGLVWREIEIVESVLIADGCCPLSATIHSSLL